jgi:hypothetical protein
MKNRIVKVLLVVLILTGAKLLFFPTKSTKASPQKQFIVVGNKKGLQFDSVGHLVFSPDGTTALRSFGSRGRLTRKTSAFQALGGLSVNGKNVLGAPLSPTR